MQRGPREHEARCLQFSIECPGDLMFILHLAHAVLTLDTGSPITLPEWDAVTTTNRQVIVQQLENCTFGERRVKWYEIFVKKGLSALQEWVFSLQQAPKKERKSNKDTGNLGYSTLSVFLCSLIVENEVLRKVESSRVNPMQ